MYRYFKGEDSKSIPVDLEFDAPHSSLDEDQIELINEVHEGYGQFSAWKLRNMTHSEAPWKKVYKKGVLNLVIPQDLIKDFFTREVLVDEDSPEFETWLTQEMSKELKKDDPTSKKVYSNVDALFADI